MRVLFIGGTGIISSACSALAVESGIDLHLLNRGRSKRPTPPGATTLEGDVRDPESFRKAVEGQTYDAVVDWIAFGTDHIEKDLDVFRGKTDQLVFISSASAYQTPAATLPILESTPLDNPFWEYSRNKIAVEERLIRAYCEEKYPVTIVRPSHTYDRTLLPFDHGWTVVDRMRRGLPVVVHGDGSSLWTLTHHRDFARAFVPLLGNPHTIGEAFHITSDEWLSWDDIYRTVARAAGVPNPHLVHVPSEVIARKVPGREGGLLGDKSNSSIFDNAKIKRTVPGWNATIPFARGAEEIIAWYDAEPARQKTDPELNRLEEDLIRWHERPVETP